jgi:MarR family transcriptional regulator, lower aerobic nicotinate degradation pathway regulator
MILIGRAKLGVANVIIDWPGQQSVKLRNVDAETPHTPASAPERVKHRATWLIRGAYARSSALLDEGFETGGNGLRGYHFRLLAALDDAHLSNVPAMSQAELGRLTGIDPSDVTAAIALLENLKLIERKTDPLDRRRNLVSITEQGRKRLDGLDSVVSDIQDRFLAPLSSVERAQFLSLLERVAIGDERATTEGADERNTQERDVTNGRTR